MNVIVDTTVFAPERILTKLPAFLEQFAAARGQESSLKLSDSPKEKGSPHTLVVAGAGLRAANITRALRKFQTKTSLVAKLFAKHIKIQEAVDTVKKS